MIIAVEGPTCSGKTTLTDLLQEKIPDAQFVHKDRPKEHTRRYVLEDYVLKHQDYQPGKQNIIFDRLHWGEATYGPIYRPDNDRGDGLGLLGTAGWRWVELFLMSRGALVARLTATPDDLVKRLADRGDDHVLNVKDLLEVSRLYDQTAQLAPSNHASYSTSGPHENIVGFANMLVAGARALERHSKPLASWPGYIGRPKPIALLVGDQRNVTEQYGEETKLPFMPVNGNSGDFLLKNLPESVWSRIGIVNANEHREPIDHLWELLDKPIVIALGHSAKRVLDHHRIPVAANYPHPQYVRRFRQRDSIAYGRAIEHTTTTGEVDTAWRQ